MKLASPSIIARVKSELKAHPSWPLALTLAGASGVSVALYLIGAVANGGLNYYYLVWNLFLAWLPLVFAYLLVKILKQNLWSSWPALSMTFLWLIFLPNSFYMLSDFVHLSDNLSANLMFNIVLISSFAFNGLVLGYLSVMKIHRRLLARGHSSDLSWLLISLTLIVSSYAIYLGRVVRLNSWDFFTNFLGVLYSVSDQFIHPGRYPSIIGLTASFFVLLTMIYVVVWRFNRYNLANER